MTTLFGRIYTPKSVKIAPSLTEIIQKLLSFISAKPFAFCLSIMWFWSISLEASFQELGTLQKLSSWQWTNWHQTRDLCKHELRYLITNLTDTKPVNFFLWERLASGATCNLLPKFWFQVCYQPNAFNISHKYYPHISPRVSLSFKHARVFINLC